MKALVLVVLAAALAVVAAYSLRLDSPTEHSGEAIRGAAEAFLETLSPDQRVRTTFDFIDEERFNWHYFPRQRAGLPLGAMTPVQRSAAHDLLRTALSEQGYQKATGVMQMEALLYEMENRSAHRNPENYFFTLFGSPAGTAPWGWRVEGHHLSFNYTDVHGPTVSVTPAFLGSNPAEVRTGPHAGYRVLGAEEEAGRALMLALDSDQRLKAMLPGDVPSDIITGADRKARLERFEGIPASEMRPDQREMLLDVIRNYTQNLRNDLSGVKLREIQDAGIELVHFAWAGGVERGQPHYYRVHGPTVLFEYDNVQNDANHAHAVWRDFEGDFGEDLLRRHYEAAH